MSGEQIAALAGLSLALVLPVLALRARGISFGQGWRMAVIWFALFALAAMFFAWLRL